MANVPHSTLVGAHLHENVGDSRTGRAWTLDAGTTDALLIENSNNNDLLKITTSTTPGSTLITFGNTTDDPAVDIYGTLRIVGATSGGYCFTVATNAGTDNPFRVFAAAANGPHTVALDEAWMRIGEVGSDPSTSANTGALYAKDAAGVTQLYYQASDGTVTQLTPASSGAGDVVGPGPTVVDTAVAIFNGTGGLTIQESAVTMSVLGAIAGATGYSQTSGNFDVTGNGTVTVGNGGTSTINIVPGSGGLNVGMLDNDSANFRVQQGADYYIRCDTTNASEKVTIGGVSPATMDVDITAGDDVTIFPSNDLDIQLSGGGNSATAFRVRDGLSLTDVYLAVDTTNDTVTIGNSVSAASTVDVNGGTGGINLNVADNDTAALNILQGANIYMRVRTSNASEGITIGGTGTNPRIDFGGTGALGKTDGSGADAAGVDMRIRAGAGTGAGTPGLLYLATPSAHASDSVVQTQTDRAIIGGSATTTTLLLGNPDADNIVATPVTTVTIAATDSGTAGTNASDLVIEAGDNSVGSGAGNGGDITIRAGSTTGTSTGTGGDIVLTGGDSGAGAGGTIRLQTGQNSSAVDRLTIEPNGAVEYVYQGATSMPAWFMERYRYTANVNGTAQDVLTYSVPSGGVTRVEVKTVWVGATAADSAFIDLTGACYNNGGTTDEVGGVAFSATGTRAGGALTDTVEVRLIADNGTDEIKLQLYKINANDFTVDVFVTVHRTA